MSQRRNRLQVLAVLLLTVLTSLTSGTVLRGVPDEQRLLTKIYRNYDNSVRPVYNATNNVVVKFGLSLIQIIDMVSDFLVKVHEVEMLL